MDVKGGVAYIDFKHTDISTNRTLVVENIYSYFNNAYNSKKRAILRNLLFNGEKLPDTNVSCVIKSGNSNFVVFCRIPSTTPATTNTRYITVSNDNTVTITTI